MDKRTRARTFRDRLATALSQAGESQAGLARRVGTDRSTISQLLTTDGPRLPNAQIAAEAAMALGVSVDWLLGLSDRQEGTADLVAAVAMPEAPRALIDDQIFAWHREAAGYKIRYVPAGLPDMIKTPAMLRWEYAPSLGRTTEQAIHASQDRLELMRSSASDYEIAIPLHEMESFVNRQGYYADLDVATRDAQLHHLAALHAQFHPRLRIFLYDGRRQFSAPVTVFGPLLAAVYLGRNYMVFRDRERIQAIATHFDALVREAIHGDRDLPGLIDGWLAR
jgi:transcriptional regulator with XRE-family HTH domain